MAFAIRGDREVLYSPHEAVWLWRRRATDLAPPEVPDLSAQRSKQEPRFISGRWPCAEGGFAGMLVLDIGCGKNKQEQSAVGLDRQAGSNADIRCELGHFPWPIKSDSADKIYLSHFLEHQLDILGAMREVHRIGKPGCEVVIVTPHYSSPDSYTDPTHFFHLGLHSFDYFVRQDFENFTYGGGDSRSSRNT